MFNNVAKDFFKKNYDFKEKAIKKLGQNVNVAFEKRTNVNNSLESDDYITSVNISITAQ